MRPRKYRIVSEHNEFYVEYQGWFFLWHRLMSLDGWASFKSLEAAYAKIDELDQPDPPRQVIYLPDRPR